MVLISKSEKEYLIKEGFKMGEDIHRTYGRSKHYYAVENEKIFDFLSKYKKSVTIDWLT